MAPLNDQIKEFAQTPTGRIAVVAVPVLLLVVIIAFIALTMLRGGETPEVETAALETSGTVSTAEPSTPAKEEKAESTADVVVSETSETTTYINENYEIYNTRDPFEPVDTSTTVSGLPLPSGSASGSSTSETVPAGSATTEILSLKSIEEGTDGKMYANVMYGSSPYLAASGDRVGSSPYEVVSVASDSATFLYGDDQVVLRVGESAGK